MAKKILFILPNMEHGGTGKSLEHLLYLMDNSKYECKVICSNPLSHGIYDEVFKDRMIAWPQWFKTFLCSTFLIRVNIFFHRYCNITFWLPIYRLAINHVARQHGIDIVVGYQENVPTHIASAFKGRSIVWIHGIYSSYMAVKKCRESCCYHIADAIVCVSQHAANELKGIMPQEAHKITHIYNVLDKEKIHNAAKKATNDARFVKEGFVIVSVGRFNWVKQFEKIPEIARKITDTGCRDFKWYIIGGGNEALMDKTATLTDRYGLKDNVIMLGSKDNPYPYIAKANLLVSTSLSESCPYVVNEAKVLHVPVVSTDYPSASELIDDNTGIVTPLQDMHAVLHRLIANKDNAYTSLSERCSNYEYQNAPMMQQIYALMEEPPCRGDNGRDTQ